MGTDDTFDMQDEYPIAPQPQHERQWRHPSEIGFAEHSLHAVNPVDIGRRGRGLVAFSGVAGFILVTGLLVLLIPGANRNDPSDIVELTNADLHIAQVHSDHPEGITMGVALFDDRILVTTSEALGALTSVEVRLPQNTIVVADLVHVFAKTGIAVLMIQQDTSLDIASTRRTASKSNPAETRFSMGQLVTVLIDQPQSFMIDDPNITKANSEDMNQSKVIKLRTVDSRPFDIWSVAEGAPIVDNSGRLIGLCTHVGGTIGFIPLLSIEEQIISLSSVGDIFSVTSVP